jgi:hypothetical protein
MYRGPELPLPKTDHPTQPSEFYEIFSRAIIDVLRLSKRGVVWNPAKFALAAQQQAIELALVNIGYFKTPTTWAFRQQGFEGKLPRVWTALPVEIFAEKIAEVGVDMLNERCRKPAVKEI